MKLSPRPLCYVGARVFAANTLARAPGLLSGCARVGRGRDILRRVSGLTVGISLC